MALSEPNLFPAFSPRASFSAAFLLLAACGSSEPGGGAEVCKDTARVEVWKRGSIAVRYNKEKEWVSYGRTDNDGYFDMFVSDINGENERRFYNPAWRDDRHHLL